MRRAFFLAVMALAATTPRAAAAQTRGSLATNGMDSSYDAVLDRAERAYAARRWSEAAALYQWTLETDDRTPQRWWELGHALFNARRHREAIGAYERALQLGAGDPAAGSWQIARAYAHRGNRRQALRWLARAVDLGFDGKEAIRQEPMFEQYRGDPRFSALADSSDAPRRSPRRVPTGRTRRAPIREIEPARLAAARSLDASEEAVGTAAAVDDALREVVGEILEPNLAIDGTHGAELGWGLAGRAGGENECVAARVDARVLELDD
jgi:tetratricopeptide (TPR) repeat protein